VNYRTIKSRGFWCDPWLLQQPKLVRYFYNYLFTGPLTNNAGLLEESPMEMALHTGLTAREINSCIDALISADKLVRHGGWLWIINFIKHQSSTSPLLIKSIGKTLEECPHSQLVATVLNKYSHLDIPYRYPIDTLSIPPPELEVELEVELKKKVENKEETPNGDPPIFSDQDLQIEKATPKKIMQLWRKRFPDNSCPKPDQKLSEASLKPIRSVCSRYPDMRWWHEYYDFLEENKWLINEYGHGKGLSFLRAIGSKIMDKILAGEYSEGRKKGEPAETQAERTRRIMDEARANGEYDGLNI